jgi:hypothetical protein
MSACGKRFLVAVTYDRPALEKLRDAYRQPMHGDIGSFHYGDPPSHRFEGCNAGATMNMGSVRVV